MCLCESNKRPSAPQADALFFFVLVYDKQIRICLHPNEKAIQQGRRMPAKLPKNKKKVMTGFRVEPGEKKKLSKLADDWNFKNPSDFLRWCVEMGQALLGSDQLRYCQLFESAVARKGATIKDPKEQDLFEIYTMKLGAEMRNTSIEAQQNFKQILQTIAE